MMTMSKDQNGKLGISPKIPNNQGNSNGPSLLNQERYKAAPVFLSKEDDYEQDGFNDEEIKVEDHIPGGGGNFFMTGETIDDNPHPPTNQEKKAPPNTENVETKNKRLAEIDDTY